MLKQVKRLVQGYTPSVDVSLQFVERIKENE